MRFSTAAIGLVSLAGIGVSNALELGLTRAFTGETFDDLDVLADLEIPDLVFTKFSEHQGDEDYLAKNPMEVVEYEFDYGRFGKLKTFAYKEGDRIYAPGAGGIFDINIETLPLNNVATDDAVVTNIPDIYEVDEFKMFRYRLCNKITESNPHEVYGLTYPLDDRINTYVDWAVSNIHSHGLYLDAEDFSDDVSMRIARGGLCLDYVYRLPTIHYPGIHWYHPHRHGASSLQVAAGLAGMMEVTNPIYDSSFPDWYKALLENRKVMQFHKIGLGILERYVDFRREIPEEDQIIFNQPIVEAKDGFESIWLVNGIAGGKLTIRDDEFRLLDFIFVDQIAFAWNFRLGDCNAWLVSRDGMPRRNGPQFLEVLKPPNDPNFNLNRECQGDDVNDPFAQVRQYRLTGATRAGIVIQCPAGRHQVRINCEDTMIIDSIRTNPNDVLDQGFDFLSELNASPDENGFTDMYNARPPYINEDKSGIDRDLTSSDGIPIQELELTAQDVTGPNTPGGLPYSRYTPNAIIETNTVYDWFLAKGQEIHPYHKHISPIMITGPCDEAEPTAYYDEGEFFDVVQALCPSSFRTIWYPTTQIHHCHILQHEDDGALGWVMIDPHYVIPCWENGTVTNADWDNFPDPPFGFKDPPKHIGAEFCSTGGRVIAEEWKDKCPSTPFGLPGLEDSPKRYFWQRNNGNEKFAEFCPPDPRIGGDLVMSALLPNPVGNDRLLEYIILKNPTSDTISFDGEDDYQLCRDRPNRRVRCTTLTGSVPPGGFYVACRNSQTYEECDIQVNFGMSNVARPDFDTIFLRKGSLADDDFVAIDETIYADPNGSNEGLCWTRASDADSSFSYQTCPSLVTSQTA